MREIKARVIKTKDDLLKAIKISDNGCWIWQGGLNTYGYGMCNHNGKQTNACRAAYILYHGDPEDGYVVCHSCDNPNCCNPNHLWAGTQAQNLQDCINKGRQRYRYGRDHHRPTAKLSEDDIKQIKKMIGTKTNTEIAKIYGVDNSQISRIKTGKYWRWVK